MCRLAKMARTPLHRGDVRTAKGSHEAEVSFPSEPAFSTVPSGGLTRDGRRYEDDFANLFLGEEILLRRDDFPQRVLLAHEGPDLATPEIADKARKHIRILGRAAEERQILQIELA